jgi:xanthine dehydrogenase YagR molybdenum-binding subunit
MQDITRPGTFERIKLGATADGALAAITHEAIAMTSRYEDFARNDTGWSGALYKCGNASYSHKLAKLDLPTPCDMRAPGAATGVYALECAMDELAIALKIDPLELRLRNYSDREQNDDLPYSSKRLRECYRQGAEAFGWFKRNAEPRSMRDGRELVGWGMATGVWEALQMKTSARIVLTANGHAEIACATADIGTGTYHHGAGRRRHARAADRQYQHQAWRLDPAASAGRGRIMDGGFSVACHRDHRRRHS